MKKGKNFVLIIAFAFVVLVLGISVLAVLGVRQCVKEIETKGLKGVVEEIWEGQNE